MRFQTPHLLLAIVVSIPDLALSAPTAPSTPHSPNQPITNFPSSGVSQSNPILASRNAFPATSGSEPTQMLKAAAGNSGNGLLPGRSVHVILPRDARPGFSIRTWLSGSGHQPAPQHSTEQRPSPPARPGVKTQATTKVPASQRSFNLKEQDQVIEAFQKSVAADKNPHPILKDMLEISKKERANIAERQSLETQKENAGRLKKYWIEQKEKRLQIAFDSLKSQFSAKSAAMRKISPRYNQEHKTELNRLESLESGPMKVVDGRIQGAKKM